MTAKRKRQTKTKAKKKAADTKKNNGATLGFEQTLWAAADKLRNNLDAAEYKHVVLGLIFLKYISDAFEEKHAELEAVKDQGADAEDPDEYRAENIFWVPKEARWSHLKANAPQPTIGKLVDDAMVAIERDNKSLKGVLPKIFARPALDKQRLGELINLVSTIGLGDEDNRSKDILGRVYEYFLSEFASAEGKKGGQFYTPRCVVQVLVSMLAPYKGRVFDPCCGSGALMLEKYEICRGLFHGFDWSAWISGTPAERLSVIPAAQEHILQQEDGKNRLLQVVNKLSKAFALAVPHDETTRVRDDVAFFQAVRTALAKTSMLERKPQDEIDHAIRQILSRAVASDEVVGIFAAAGLKNPDISILSDEFLAEVQGMPHRNLAVELLQKLLKDELKVRSRKYLVQSRAFSELLEASLRRYLNRAIEAAQVIEELIQLAKDMREANQRGENIGLREDELAFYDALEVNDSAVQVLGDDTLKTIARELVEAVRNSATVDWTVKESVRAKMRVMVRRILRKYGYPPDKQEKATQTVLEQAELLCGEWVA